MRKIFIWNILAFRFSSPIYQKKGKQFDSLRFYFGMILLHSKRHWSWKLMLVWFLSIKLFPNHNKTISKCACNEECQLAACQQWMLFVFVVVKDRTANKAMYKLYPVDEKGWTIPVFALQHKHLTSYLNTTNGTLTIAFLFQTPKWGHTRTKLQCREEPSSPPPPVQLFVDALWLQDAQSVT